MAPTAGVDDTSGREERGGEAGGEGRGGRGGERAEQGAVEDKSAPGGEGSRPLERARSGRAATDQLPEGLLQSLPCLGAVAQAGVANEAVCAVDRGGSEGLTYDVPRAGQWREKSHEGEHPLRGFRRARNAELAERRVADRPRLRLVLDGGLRLLGPASEDTPRGGALAVLHTAGGDPSVPPGAPQGGTNPGGVRRASCGMTDRQRDTQPCGLSGRRQRSIL